jgi:MoxR-like ATPase
MGKMKVRKRVNKNIVENETDEEEPSENEANENKIYEETEKPTVVNQTQPQMNISNTIQNEQLNTNEKAELSREYVEERKKIRNSIKTSQLLSFLDKIYDANLVPFLKGMYGIGKSDIVYQLAELEAEKESKKEGKERKFVVWHKLTNEEKQKVIEHPEDYFVLVDIKLQSLGDPSELRGLPILDRQGNMSIVRWELPSFIKALIHPNAKGILFLDEINMAPYGMQSTAFEIAQQKKIGDYTLSGGVRVIAAGNPRTVNISANPIPQPLINRMVTIDFAKFVGLDEWIKWAIQNDIDSRIIAFLKVFNDEYIRTPYSMGETDADEALVPSTTPRSWANLSRLIKDNEDLRYIEYCTESLLYPTTAAKFLAFLRAMQSLNYKEYILNPQKFVEFDDEPEKQYGLVTLISKHANEVDNNKSGIKEKDLLNFINYLAENRPDFAVLLLTLMKIDNGGVLERIIPELPNKIYDKIADILS